MNENLQERYSIPETCSTGRSSASKNMTKDTHRVRVNNVTENSNSERNSLPRKPVGDFLSNLKSDPNRIAPVHVPPNRTARARCILMGRHYSVLMWKNMILRRRRPGFLVAELITPILITCVLIILCRRGEENRHSNCYSQTISMPSMGLLSFFQSLVCNFAYSCFDVEPPPLTLFGNETGWAELLNRTQELAEDSWIEQVASGVVIEPVSGETIKRINNVRISLIRLFETYQGLLEDIEQSSQSDDVITVLKTNISLSTLNQLGNISRLICGSPSEQNDIGLLVLFLKSLNGTSISKATSVSLNRVARDADMGSWTTEHPPIQETETITTSANSKNTSNMNSTTNTPGELFCENLIEFLMIKPIQPYTERIRSFLFSYVYYYPSTKVTDEIMQRATASHRLLSRTRDVFNQLVNKTLPALKIYLTASAPMNQTRQVLKACVKLGSEYSTVCRQLWNFLDPNATSNPNQTGRNIFTLLDRFRDFSELVLNFLNCMNLNNRAVPSTREQFERYMSLFQNPTFPTGIGVDFRRVPDTLNWSTITNTSEHVLEVALRKNGGTYKFKVFDRYWTPRPRQNPRDGDMNYFSTGFIDLQESISQAILSIAWSKPDLLNKPVDLDDLYTSRITGNEMKLFPTACYIDRSFLGSMAKMFPQFMLFAWIFTAMFTAKCIVDEKEQRLKEFTKIMGVSNITHWFGWLTMNLLIMLTCTVLITILLKYTRVITDTNYGILLFLFFSYTLSVIALTFLCSTFFTHANLGAVVTGMIYFILYLPTPMILSNDASLPTGAFYGASLSSQVAFSLGLYYVIRSEAYGTGTQWSTFWSSNRDVSGFSVGKAVLMLWVDTVIYLILTWYIEAVYPGHYGIRQPFYFPFTRSYWCGEKRPETDTSSWDDDLKALTYFGNQNDPRFFESPPAHAAVGIAVRDLNKRYKKGAKPVLDGLTMNFYANQITSLLGHNGAGKSTLMSILTGMQSASSGLALVGGYDVGKNLEIVRDMLGFCPQYNILFDHLTIAEHIYFYSALKGVPNQLISTETDHLVKVLGFPDKRDERSKSLSGGQKRKLSVAIAFVGNSEVVFLDEPTAGVDPYSRRSIWDLIICLKSGRTIVLTTHHMDEADILGDRIAIISQGRLKCEGSGLFLKANHGQGYYLVLHRNTSNENFSAELSESVHNKKVLDYVQQFMPEAELVSVAATELTVQLPGHYATDGTFTKFFDHLESNAPHHVSDALLKLGIVNYSLSDTSLEEVFLDMADDPSNRQESQEESESLDTSNISVDSGNSLTYTYGETRTNDYADGNEKKRKPGGGHFSRGRSQLAQLRRSSRLQRFTDGGQLPTPATRHSLIDRQTLFSHVVTAAKQSDTTYKSLTWFKPPTSEDLQVSMTQQLRAMFPKRFHHFKRYKRGWIIQFLLPILLTLLALSFDSIVVHQKVDNPPMPLNPWWMAPTQGILSTFYENRAHAVEDPPNEWPLSSELIQHVRTEYENALRSLYGWTGTRCLPRDVYQFMPSKHDSCQYNWTSLPAWEPQFELNTDEREIARNSSRIQCSCHTGSMLCPKDCVQPSPPPHVSLQTTDVLFNLTAYDVNDYLLKTHDDFFLRRFGGLSFIIDPSWSIRGLLEQTLDPNNPLYTIMGMLTSVRRGNSGLVSPDPVWSELANCIRLMLPPPYHTQIWFNNKGYVSAVGYLNVLQNMQLRMVQGADQIPNRKSYGLVIVDHPLESPANYTLRNTGSLIYDVTLVLFTILALSFIPASFITFLVLEVQTGSKHLQFLSGLNGYIYWVSVYLWDVANYLAPATLCVLVFVAFQKYAYIGTDVIGVFFGLIILYGLSVLPMLYPSSFFIRNPSTALVIVAVFNLLLGAITVMITFLLDYLERTDDKLAQANSALQSAFLIFPQYAFGRGLYNLAVRYYMLSYGGDSGLLNVDEWRNPVAWKVVGRNLFAMGLESILYSGLVVLVEHEFYRNEIRNFFYTRYPRLRNRHEYHLRKRLAKLDREEGSALAEDVRKEQDQVHQLQLTGSLHTSSSVSTVNLVKFFPRRKKPTVNRLTFAVRPAECFGLLGLNGAGKTTTFRMLSGCLQPTMGDAFVNGFHVVDQKRQAHQSLGYCPQFDALFDLLTGRETLTLYSRLRGVPENEISQVVYQLLSDMSLAPHADKIAGAYSGGNRRKLSTAIALLGGPKVIFLDEPTSGMDPVGKRFLWDQITNLLHCGKSIVLTTHSMEECEALCHRLGIMVNGQFRCFGTVPQLKDLFGNGYTVELRTTNQPNVGDQVRALIAAEFPQAEVNGIQSRCHEYQFNQGIFLSQLFTVLNKLRQSKLIEQYSVRQTTLDQVFVNFTRLQMEQGETSVSVEELSDTDVDDKETPPAEKGMSNNAFHSD